jgi:D-alanyl-D-alanine carboxypeptidase/D-alanyl-D-alanine-endopeptidase (penicillin-binding protein 4)
MKTLYKVFLIIIFSFGINGLNAQSPGPLPKKVLEETYLPEFTHADRAKSLEDFKNSIDKILQNRYLNNSDYSIAIYSLDNDSWYYKKDIQKLLTPASNTKLYTTFGILKRFGPEYKVPTEIFTDGNFVADTMIKGNVYIVGNGDPMLTINDIELLTEKIYRLGIRRITGNIYADGSFFDGETNRFHYSGDDDEVAKLPPVTALSIEENQATVLITSGNKAGAYVNVQLIPESETFGKYVTAKVRGYKSKKSHDSRIPLQNEFFRDDSLRAGDELMMPVSARRRSVRVSSSKSDDGRQMFKVSGYLYPNRTVSYRYYMLDPVLSVGGVFKNRLETVGITVDGSLEAGSLNEIDSLHHLTLLTYFERPITEIIDITNKESDNYYAETLFKMLGADAGLDSINWNSCRTEMKRIMTDLEIPFEGCELNDGSGLSRRNLVTAESLIKVLKRAHELNFRKEFENSFSIAGEDGTLRKRMRKTRAEQNVKGKTGTLRNVSSLSGYAYTLDGEKLAYSFIFNGRNVGTYKNIEDELCEVMANFFYYNYIR